MVRRQKKKLFLEVEAQSLRSNEFLLSLYLLIKVNIAVSQRLILR